MDAMGVGNCRFLAENIKDGEICHLWLPIRVMASSRKARMGDKEVRTSLSNRQTGTCSCIAWMYCERAGRKCVKRLRPIFSLMAARILIVRGSVAWQRMDIEPQTGIGDFRHSVTDSP